MQNININLKTKDGRKAKDITENNRIRKVIENHEKLASQFTNTDEKQNIGIIEEEGEEDDDFEEANSSISPSPVLNKRDLASSKYSNN